MANKRRVPSPVNGQILPEGKPFTPGEKARECARKGGQRSAQVRRERADLRRQASMWLEENVSTDKNGNPLTGAELMIRVAVREMSKGNPKFWELLRDTAGFKPVDKVMVADVDQSVVNEVETMVKEASASDL